MLASHVCPSICLAVAVAVAVLSLSSGWGRSLLARYQPLPCTLIDGSNLADMSLLSVDDIPVPCRAL